MIDDDRKAVLVVDAMPSTQAQVVNTSTQLSLKAILFTKKAHHPTTQYRTEEDA